MKVIVFGSRNGHPDVIRILNGLYRRGDPWTLVITGGGTGVDEQAEVLALAHGIPTSRHPADWLKHGKAAGPIRNNDR